MNSSLIPELPDDSFAAARSVSKLWRQKLGSPYSLRFSQGELVIFAQAELPLATSGPAKKYARPIYRLTQYEPGTNSWSSLPPIPGFPNGLPLFCQIAAAERQLIVIGGWDSETWAVSDAVYIYDFSTGEWRVGTPMPGPRRSFFGAAAGAASGGVVVLVAGGHDGEKNALRSTLAYDVAGDKWTALPDMACERDECHVVYSSGKFCVIGGYSKETQGKFSTSMEVLDLMTLKWQMMENDRVKCQSELSVEVKASPQVVGWEGSLMVKGSGSHGAPQAVYVMREGEKVPLWKMVELPEEYSGHIQAVCCVEI